MRGLLHRKLITWKVLREAIEKTDAREQDAIKQLRQRYRDQVFETFYKQIDEYGRRQDAWNAVLQSWQAAGGPFEQQDRLIDWLEAGIRSASPKTIGPVAGEAGFRRRSRRGDCETASGEEGGRAGETAGGEEAGRAGETASGEEAEEPAKPQAEKKAEEPAKPQAEKKPGGGTPPPACRANPACRRRRRSGW